MDGIDYTIIGVYLIATLILGIYKGWRVWDIAEYAIGGKKHTTLSLTLTIAATIIGAGTVMGTAEQVFKVGIVYIIAVLGVTLSFFFTAKFFMAKLPQFSNCLSVASVIGSVYGKGPRLLTSIIGFLYLAALLGTQLRGLGYWMGQLCDIPYTQALLLGAGITVLYSAFGGIKGVTFTDIYQFFLIILGIPLIGWFGVRSVGGLDAIFSVLPAEKVNPFLHPKLFTEYLPLFIIFALPIFSPQLSQRLLMAHSIKQAKHSLYYMSFLFVPFFLMIGLIGLVALARTPTLPPNQAFSSIVLTLLPTGVKGLAIVGILAVIMSTADSVINTAGVLFAHDIINPLFKERLTGYQQMVLARWACLVVGFVGIWTASSTKDILSLFMVRSSFWIPCVVVPIMMTFLGYRTSSKRFYLAVVAGMTTFICWDHFVKPITHINPILPSMFGNLLVFLDFSFLWSMWKTKQHQKKLIQWDKKTFLSKFKNEVLKINLLAETSRRMVARDGAPILAFTSFLLANYLVPVFLWTHDFSHFRMVVTLRIISAFMLISLLMRNSWPTPLQKYWPFMWHLTLLFTLPCLATFSLLDAPNFLLFGINLILSLLLLIFMIDTRAFCIFTLIGCGMGLILHWIVNCIYPEIMNWENFPKDIRLVVYLGLFAIISAGLFIRKRAWLIEQRILGMQRMGSALLRETSDHLSALNLLAKNHSDALSKCLDSAEKMNVNLGVDLSSKDVAFSFEKQKGLFKAVFAPFNTRLKILDILRKPYPKVQANFINAQTLLENFMKQYPFKAGEKDKVHVAHFRDFTFLGDEPLLNLILTCLVKNALVSVAKNIHGQVKLYNQGYGNEGWIVVEDDGDGIDSVSKTYLFDPLASLDNEKTGISLYFCKKMMEEMGHVMDCYSMPNKGTQFFLNFHVVSPTDKN